MKKSLCSVSSNGDTQTAVEIATNLREDDAASLARILDADGIHAAELFFEHVKGYSPQEAQIILCNYSYSAFAYRYLGHHFYTSMSPLYHGEYFKLLAAVERHLTTKPTLVSAPRESGKSTCGNLLMPLHAIHYPVIQMTPQRVRVDLSKRYIVYLCSTQRAATKPLFDICAELETNTALHRDFGNFYLEADGSKPNDRPWSKTEAVTSNGIKLEAAGRFSKLRGLKFMQFRPDLINVDDVEDDKSVLSATRRMEDMEWFGRALINILSEHNGNLMVLGTLLHENSLLSQLITFGMQHEWNVRVFPVYTDAPDGDRTYLWPEKFGPDWIERKLTEITPSAFAQEYLHQPGSQNPDLKAEDIAFYDDSYDSVLEAVERGRYMVMMGVDPAAKTSDRNDYTAIVPVALDPDTGIRYVLPAYIERANWGAKIQNILTMYDKCHAHTVGIESVQFQIALKEAIDLEARKRGLSINTVPIEQKQDKKLRISRLFGSISSGTIRFLRHRTHSIIIDQLLHLYTCDHDDGADALEIANGMIDRKQKRLSTRSRAFATIG